LQQSSRLHLSSASQPASQLSPVAKASRLK
jgi:hypothetical protein